MDQVVQAQKKTPALTRVPIQTHSKELNMTFRIAPRRMPAYSQRAAEFARIMGGAR